MFISYLMFKRYFINWSGLKSAFSILLLDGFSQKLKNNIYLYHREILKFLFKNQWSENASVRYQSESVDSAAMEDL